jgi:hypothetical protein
MFHTLFGHAKAHGIAGVKRVGFDETDLVIPGFGPVPAFFTGQP